MKLLWIVVLASLAQAQPTFEVASLKPASSGNNGVRGGCHGIDSRYAPNQLASAPPVGRCVITDARLGHLLFIAYQLHSMVFLKGGPDWVKMGDDRFNLEAKAEDPAKATEAQLFQMMQALLAERFHLKFHRETREMPGYALVVGKNGPKLKEAAGEDFVEKWERGPSQGPNTLTVRRYTMARLAERLAVFGDPVMDETKLTGAYDFTLSWDEAEGPLLTTALQQQLGLKLESQKVPVSFFIVESAQKPTEN